MAYDVQQQDEVTDGAGNVVKVDTKKKTNLTRKEKMARKKAKDAARARGEDVSSDDED